MLKSRLIPKQTGLAGLQSSDSKAFGEGKRQYGIRMKNAALGELAQSGDEPCTSLLSISGGEKRRINGSLFF